MTPAARAVVPSVADDSAVYATLIAPDSQGGRGRAVGPALDLRRMTDHGSLGAALARRAPGFDSTLVSALHGSAPDGRGPGVALRARPSLLWNAARADSVRRMRKPRDTAADMERVEIDPQYIALQFSVVQYSADGEWALVLENMSCGPLCGAERYAVLRREARGWRVVTTLVTAMS